MRFQLLLSVILLTLTQIAAGQTDTVPTSEFTAIFKDRQGAVLVLQDIEFASESGTESRTTDNFGRIWLKLRPGVYRLSITPEHADNFNAFIKITENGPNPRDVMFDVDGCEICCGDCKEKEWPRPVFLAKPPYPVTANAVRAFGAVNVQVVIAPDGSVTNASAVSGHPLLRAVSAAAARASKFEATSDKSERNCVITYGFFFGVPPQTLKRRVGRFHVVVEMADETIEIRETKVPSSK